MKNVLFGFLLAVGLAALAGNVEANLIPDGGFETQGAANVGIPITDGLWGDYQWTKQGSVYWEITDTDAHSGNYSLEYNGSGEYALTNLIHEMGSVDEPWIVLKPNTDYVFSFWEKGSASMTTMSIGNPFYGGLGPFVSITGQTYWGGTAFVGYLSTPYTSPPLSSQVFGTWWTPMPQGPGSVGTGDWVQVEVEFRTPLANWCWFCSPIGQEARLYLQMAGNSTSPAYFDDFELAEKNPPPVASISVSDAVIPVPVFFEVSPQSLNVKSKGDEFTAAQLVMDVDAAAVATANVPVSLSASDPNGTIASYEVKLGTVLKANGTGTPPASITLLNVSQGSYTVTLNVTDNGGASASASQNFSVSVGSMTELLNKNYNLIVNGISIPATAYDPTVVIGADRQAVINAIGPVDGLGVSVTIYITGYVTGSDVIEAFDPTGGRKIGQ